MPWEGPVLFLDGTEDASLTTMIKQRGKSVFNEPKMAPLFVYRPKVDTGFDPLMGAPLQMTEEQKSKMETLGN